jgi:hypothetical protein
VLPLVFDPAVLPLVFDPGVLLLVFDPDVLPLVFDPDVLLPDPIVAFASVHCAPPDAPADALDPAVPVAPAVP